MKKKLNMQIFFAIVLMQSLAANFAHPITPTLLMNLKVSDYMFGLAFAMMSFALFLFSPFWGKMREFFSAKILLLIGCAGYAFGQFLFGISKTEGSILFARAVSGFFVGAVGVSILIYVTEKSNKSVVGENLAKLAIIQALGGSFGYFIGGIIGLYSIPLTFHLQTFTLVLCGLLFFFLLEDTERKKENGIAVKDLMKEVNPLKSFLECRYFLKGYFTVILAVILIFTVGVNAFDQAFNYYLKAELHFSSLYNGGLKAVTGLITLFIVSTVCMRIMKKGEIMKHTVFILLLIFASVIGIMVSKATGIILGLAVLIHSMYAVVNPLLQDIMVKEGGEKGKNMLMGLYNSVRSLGMILGALFSGFLYSYNPKHPFILATASFLGSALIMMGLNRQLSRKNDKK